MNTKVYQAVMARAGKRCEACRRIHLELHLDHWEGGSGRRRQKESVETCWGLCPPCDRDRTDNFPTAEFWNEIRKAHCKRHRIPFVPHIVHKPVQRIMGDSFGENIRSRG